MNCNFSHKNFVLTAVSAAVLMALNPSLAADESEDYGDIELETLSVTANKYSQELVTLSGQAEVADSKTLENHEVAAVNDLTTISSALVPQTGFGSSLYTKYTVRGINSANLYNPGVAVYVDGIVQPFTQNTQPLNDVSTVEILKGPQGSVYGTGAQTGIISITTKNPLTDGNYLDLETDYSRLYWKNKADAGGELYDKTLYGKIGVSTKEDFGWIKDPNGNKFNTGESYSVNGALIYSGGENIPLTVTLGGSYVKERGHQSNVDLTESEYRAERISGNGIILNPNYTRSYLAQNVAAVPEMAEAFGGYEASYEALYNSGAINDVITPEEDRNSYTGYLKAEYFLDNGDSINSVTSYNRSEACEFYMMGQEKCNNNELKTYQLNQEIRYTGLIGKEGANRDAGKYLVGITYNHSRLDNYVLAQVDVSSNELYQMVTGGAQYFPIGQVDAGITDDSAAIFGDVIYNFGLGGDYILDVDLGARYEYSRSKANGTYNFGYSYDSVSDHYSLFDYKAGLGFTYMPGQRIYILSSSGSKAGGFSKFPTSELDRQGYNPEKTYNYELGYHLETDNGFDANAALFYMDVHDRQAYIMVENSYMTPLRNMGRMTSAGAELTTGYRSERFTGGLSMTYANAKNHTDNYTTNPSCAPRFVGVALADVMALKFSNAKIHLGGDARYTSSSYFDEGYLSTYENYGISQQKQGGYTIFDAYVSMNIIDSIEVKAYMENIGDKKYARAIDNGSTYGQRFYSMGAPRNFGLKLKYSF